MTAGKAVQAALEAGLAARLGGVPEVQALGEGVGGARWRLTREDRSWFLKTGDGDVLAAEADGLLALVRAGALRVPAVESSGAGPEGGYLLLEWLPLVRAGAGTAARLGEALARQHLLRAERFGWPRPNFIGATPQFNTQGEDWLAYFREQRLGFQLHLAAESGGRGELQERGAELMARLPAFFPGYQPHPALLHGDLWGGNWGALQDSGPVVFDPAVYYGDRECDLAMTELFGGFPSEFYAAYRLHAPLDPGYALRRHLYNLYHLLNHFNLFGAGYLQQCLELMRRLLAELG